MRSTSAARRSRSTRRRPSTCPTSHDGSCRNNDLMDATQDRLRGLVDAGIALTSNLSLDAVLQQLVETAADLTGARYAALGVIDASGTELERFITFGVDAETHQRIGDLPRGRGILGVLIHDATPLRLHDIRDDHRSVGFPPGHPTMTTFLGVPVLLRGVAYGNLYLSEKHDGSDFTESDEELVTLLGGQAAVAIENARLYESATRWSRQLESLNEVATALVSETSLAPLLRLIADRLRDLLGARLVVISLPVADGGMTVAAASGEHAEATQAHPHISDRSKTRRVLERRRSERVDSVLEDPEVDQDVARRWGYISGVWVPLIVEAQELERRRLARELHDETGQALTSILLGLRGVEEAATEKERVNAAADLREFVVSTLQDVRRLAVELRPKALDDFGLFPALVRLAQTFTEQMGIETDVEASLGGERLPPEIETALYRIVQEALTNVVKHARASRVSISLVRKSHSVSVVIEDDGVGMTTASSDGTGLGLGIIGMRERVGLLDGRLEVESDEGRGTTIVAEVPL